ncbi:hypothetical protein J2Z32_004482 [Paenibacillus turicensis]|uniref:Phage protein n=1 Tax=Paenibacillus turicensis TaxID=160487 RepID=A0ABS4FYY8_9BACL|nr:hypothetical protein [Paenibacillus turicensis]MBP1907793.1 hypothetical protein [Paenibacillus turicensis]
MKKRQKKKNLYKKLLNHSKEALEHYKVSGIDITACECCGEDLDKNDEYHNKYGTCDQYCYGKLVGVYY